MINTLPSITADKSVRGSKRSSPQKACPEAQSDPVSDPFNPSMAMLPSPAKVNGRVFNYKFQFNTVGGKLI
jgi:hypothetical protein